MELLITLTIIAILVVKSPQIQMILMHGWYKIVQPWPQIEIQEENDTE